jgi:hypothetical protein
MCRGGRVRAAVLIAAAFVVSCLCVSARPGRAADDDEVRVLLFSGRDIWRNGAFAYGGLLMAPGGVDQDGILLKVLLSGSLYRYNAGSLGGEQVIGAEGTLQVLPGWRVKRADLEVKVFFGPDVEVHRLWPDDPSNLLRGRAFGLRMATEIWYEPTASSMIAADASMSTIATNHSARAAYGWRVLDQFYFGPETQFFASDGYRHLRLGAHFTALKTDNNEWLAAGGWARDSDGHSSPYVRLGVVMRQ